MPQVKTDSADKVAANYTETRLNLDPLNSNSFFATQVSAASASSMTLQWPSAPGLSFSILHSDDLTIPVGDWLPLVPNVPADSVGSTTSYPIDISGDDVQFFSVELLPEVP